MGGSQAGVKSAGLNIGKLKCVRSLRHRGQEEGLRLAVSVALQIKRRGMSIATRAQRVSKKNRKE